MNWFMGKYVICMYKDLFDGDNTKKYKEESAWASYKK